MPRTLADAWVSVSPDTSRFMGEARAKVQAALRGVDASIPVTANTKPALAGLAALQAGVKALSARMASVTVGLNDARALGEIGVLQARLTAINNRVISPKVTDLGIAKATAGVLTLNTALDGTLARLAGTAAAGGKGGGGVAGGIIGGLLGGRGGGKGGGVNVPLFGGALPNWLPALAATATGFHLVTEAIVETTAVIVPAVVAFGAFGAAAVPTVTDLQKILSSTYTASQALGQSVYPLTGGFQKVADAVKPYVYTLFGEALTIINRNTGTFQTLATGAAKVLTDLGSRFTYAVTSGTGFSSFTRNAVKDLAGLGNLVGNVGGIIGGVMKVLPGYAADILNVAQSVTGFAENVVNSKIGQGLLGIGLQAHGALLYIGLLATGASTLITKTLPLIASAAAGAASGLGKIGASGAAGMMTKFSGAVKGAATLPWGWIAIAAAGLGFLGFTLANVKDQTQQFADAVQSRLLSGPLQTLGSTIQSTLTSSIMGAQKAQADYLILLGQSHGFDVQHTMTRQQAADLQNAADKAANLDAVVKLAQSDQVTYTANLKQYNAVLGDTATTLADMTGAGITSEQFLSKNPQQIQQNILAAQGYDNALRTVTQSAGRFGAAQNALNFAAGDSVNALGQIDATMSKVVQAQDQLTGVITGGESAFLAFQQSILGTSAKFVAPKGLADAAKLAGGNIGGLSEQSRAFADTFYNVVLPAYNKQITSLENQGIATGDLTKVVATGAGQMLQYTGKNLEARAVIVGLINNALGPGTVTLQGLDKWVKTNTTSMGGYNKIIGTSTVNAGSLAGVLNGLTGQMYSQDLLLNSKLTPDMSAYTKAVVTYGQNSPQAHQALQTLNDDMSTFNKNTGLAITLPPQLQKQIDALHGKDLLLRVNVAGSGAVSANVQGGMASVQGANGRLVFGAAAGGAVYGPGGPTADLVPAMLSAGEFVVNAASAKRIGYGALSKMNKMAAGGPAVAGDAYSRVYDWESGKSSAFARGDATWFANAEVTAFQKAIAKLVSASGYVPGTPATGGTILQEQQFAASLFPQYGWPVSYEMPPLISLWTQESGWDPYAVNPASGAAGIPQALGHGNVFALGDWANQIRWGENYIHTTYGDPIAAWAHEQANNWYAKGGLVGLRGSEALEAREYAGLRSAFGYSFRHAKPGSWLSRNRKSVTGELATLGRRQLAESAAYHGISTGHFSKASLQHFAAAARAEAGTALDKALVHVHPEDMKHLAATLATLSTEALHMTPGGGKGGKPPVDPLARASAALLRYDLAAMKPTSLGGGFGFAGGGVVGEPVYGFGARSGMPYSFAEHGPESVVAGAFGMDQNTRQLATRLDKLIAAVQAQASIIGTMLHGDAARGHMHGYYGRG